jgi:hypothetical protein
MASKGFGFNSEFFEKAPGADRYGADRRLGDVGCPKQFLDPAVFFRIVLWYRINSVN